MPIPPAHPTDPDHVTSEDGRSAPSPGGPGDSSFRGGPTIPLVLAAKIHAQLRWEMMSLALVFQWPSIPT